MADGHGRRARARGARDPGRGRVPRARCASAGCPSWCSPTTRSTRRATCRRGCASAASTCRRTRSGPRRSPPRASSHDQRPGGTAFVIGEAGLTTALHEAGYTLTDRDPDYVVLGETRTYSFERITQGDPADRRRARASSRPTPTRPARRPTGRCRPPARSRR